MKKLSMILAALACFGLLLGACGSDDDEGTDCDKAGKIQTDAQKAYCTGQKDTCCTCKCFLEDKDEKTSDPCECEDGESCEDNPETEEDECAPPKCEGTLLEDAQTCLNDETVCKAGATAWLKAICEPGA